MNRMAAILVTIVCSLVFIGSPLASIPRTGATSEAWVQFQHDAQHSGRSGATGPETANDKWSKKLDGAISGAPVIGADGTIYVGTYYGTLYAIHADGSIRWKLATGGQLLHSPAVGADGTIYCSCQDGNLYAVTAEGVVKWKVSVQEYGAVVSNIRSAPTLAPDGTIYLTSTFQIGTSVSGKLRAVAPDGSVRWTFPLENVSTAPALAGDGTIYVGAADNERAQLYAIQPDGSLKWSVPVQARLNASPVVTPDGRIYACSENGTVEAFNADGSSSWRFDVSAEVGFTPALAADGTLYVPTLSSDISSNLYAIRPDGTRLWNYSYLDKEQVWFASNISSSPAVDGGGVVYFGTDMTKLIALTPDGTEKWLWVGESLPSWNSRLTTAAIGPDHTLYIGDSQGYLYAIGEPGSVTPTPSPTAAGDFTDVGSDYWASVAIQSLVQAGIVNGYPDGSFRPEQSVSRAEFAKMVVTALDLSFVLVEYPSFPDVPGNHWALTYVETALVNDLMKGYPDGLFQPAGKITLAEILTVIVRAKDWALVDPPDPPPQLLVWEAGGSVRHLAPSDWFYQTVGAAMESGLLSFPEDPHLASPGPGSDEYSIHFQEPASRAQTAFLLERMMR